LVAWCNGNKGQPNGVVRCPPLPSLANITSLTHIHVRHVVLGLHAAERLVCPVRTAAYAAWPPRTPVPLTHPLTAPSYHTHRCLCGGSSCRGYMFPRMKGEVIKPLHTTEAGRASVTNATEGCPGTSRSTGPHVRLSGGGDKGGSVGQRSSGAPGVPQARVTLTTAAAAGKSGAPSSKNGGGVSNGGGGSCKPPLPGSQGGGGGGGKKWGSNGTSHKAGGGGKGGSGAAGGSGGNGVKGTGGSDTAARGGSGGGKGGSGSGGSSGVDGSGKGGSLGSPDNGLSKSLQAYVACIDAHKKRRAVQGDEVRGRVQQLASPPPAAPPSNHLTNSTAVTDSPAAVMVS
jgi:hypothetical protein